MMNKEFVPYAEALALKELGFNEPCFGIWMERGDRHDVIYVAKQEDAWMAEQNDGILAPLYQQAFRWFESKGYRNYVASNHFGGKVNYWFAITPPKELTYSDIKGRNSKEEAELACLVALIEIVKKK